MHDPTKVTIPIDVVSDVVCPWCYIGKQRLEKAITALNARFNFHVVYHPFELNPAIPERGLDLIPYLTDKFGGTARYHQVISHVTRVAGEEGLDFRFDLQTNAPNTRRAHALLLRALELGVQHKLTASLFQAYFTDGMNLSDETVLRALAIDAGMADEAVSRTLHDPESMIAVEQAERLWQSLGITSVPFYIVNRKYALSGAQPVEVFSEILGKAAQEQAA